MQQSHFSYAYIVQLAMAVGVVVLLAGLALIHVIAIVWARVYFYRRVEPIDAETARHMPGVSILKPLVGIDKNVYANLETYFTLQYPRYEILFCLESSDDIVSMVVDTLMEKYPNVDARVFKCPKHTTVNPKVNNMLQGYDYAKYNLILISDSGVRMLPQALTDMVRCMKRDVGLVHQMPFTVQRPGFDNVVQSTYFGGTHAKIYITANLFGINCTTGMSCLFRKPQLGALPGGLGYFGRYLAEDFFLSQYFKSQGYRVVLSHYPALQDGNTSVGNLRRRLIRWIKLRSAMIPHVVLLEPLTDCFLSGLMGAWALAFLFPAGVNVYAYFLIHCLVWLLFDHLLLLSCMESSTPFNRFAYVCAWLMCTTMSPLNVVSAQCQPDVEWRGRKFRLMWGGVTKEISTPSTPTISPEPPPPPPPPPPHSTLLSLSATPSACEEKLLTPSVVPVLTPAVVAASPAVTINIPAPAAGAAASLSSSTSASGSSPASVSAVSASLKISV